MMKYSQTTGGFYDDSSLAVPSDAVEITEVYHRELLDGQSSGKIIKAGDDGQPYLEERPTPTVQQLAENRIQIINAEANRELAKLGASYPEHEVDSWYRQVREAEDLQTNPDAPATLLRGMANARGITVEDLASRVLAKADSFAAVSGPIMGKRQALEDQKDQILADFDSGTVREDQARTALNTLAW